MTEDHLKRLEAALDAHEPGTAAYSEAVRRACVALDALLAEHYVPRPRVVWPGEDE